MSHVTLALIVRDEAQNLPGLLEAAAGMYDAIVAVDTGSTDRTVPLLEAAGARVLHHPWADDFAAARNVGLEAVQGDWVVVLDADERPSRELVAAVRATAHRDDVGAATFTLVNPLPHGHVRETPLLRMFRNAPEARFRMPIHEEIHTGVGQYLQRTGKRIVPLPGTALHLGYARGVMQARGKRARDEQLLRQQVATAPSDLYSWFKLLELGEFWSDAALVREAAGGAAAALARVPAQALPRLHFLPELVVSLSRALHPTAPAGRAFLDRYAPLLKDSPVLLHERACRAELAGDLAAAVVDFSRCLDLKGSHGQRQLTTVRPLMGLARVALACGDGPGARRLITMALRHNPRDPEALLAHAADAAARGEALEDWVRRRQAEDGAFPEQWAAAGEVALLSGQPACAAAWLRCAFDAGGGDWTRLAQALLCAGDHAGCFALVDAHPDEPALVDAARLACAVATGGPLPAPLQDALTRRALEGWASALALCGKPGLRSALEAQRPGAVRP